MRLEVIADDVYFEPWSSDFNVKTTKKVNIVVSEQIEDEKPKLKVEVIQPKEDTKVVNENKVKEQKQKISSNVILTKKDILKLFK
jgi:hypothetical protein